MSAAQKGKKAKVGSDKPHETEVAPPSPFFKNV